MPVGSASSDARDSDEETEGRLPLPPSPPGRVPSVSAHYPSEQHVQLASVLLKAMARLVWRNPEFLSLLFVSFLVVVVSKFALNSGASRSPAIPAPIFPKDSPVFEFSDGNMQSAMSRIQREDNEFAFVMYYAHWDGNSRDVAVEFDKAARQLSHQVTFVAVNCWWLYGSCRNRIQTPMYPALLATVPSVRSGLQFTGIPQADEMVSFLHQLCRPFTYIPDMDTFYRLHAQKETLVVGYFDWSGFPVPPGLASFQKAAWLALEKDVIEPVAFAVVTNHRLASRLGLEHKQSIAMKRALNSTLLYPRDAKFQAKLIMDWAYEHRESVVQWLAPAGVKSTIMASQIGRRPAVVLFTHHHHRRGFRNDFYLLKEIALDYFNCNKSEHAQKIIRTIQHARSADPNQDGDCYEEGAQSADILSACDCCQTLADVPLNILSACDCCQTLADVPLTVTTSEGRNVCQVCEQSSRVHPSSCSPAPSSHTQAAMMNFIVHGRASLAPDSCLHMNYYYSPYNSLQYCCKQCDTPPQWMGDRGEQRAFTQGETSLDSVCSQVFSRTDCRGCRPTFGSSAGRKKWTRASNAETNQNSCSRTSGSQKSVFHPYLGPFTGLGCRTNRTVNFFAMRWEYFGVFAEQLGVPNVRGNKTQGRKEMAVFLLDIEAEQQHFLDEDVTASAIRHFIFNYTTSNLTRHLRSASHSTPSVCSQVSSTCIQEVVSSTFEQLVLDNTKDVLLLYYAPWCGFCTRMHHVYLTLAKVFQNSSNLLLARIDGDANDLPWHLTPSSYPTLLLFPAGHKERSLQFPPSTALNLPNMIKFVLQHTTLLL